MLLLPWQSWPSFPVYTLHHSDFEGKILVIPIFLLCSLREYCFTLVLSELWGSPYSILITWTLISSLVVSRVCSDAREIRSLPPVNCESPYVELKSETWDKWAVSGDLSLCCALNKYRVWGCSQCNQRDNKIHMILNVATHKHVAIFHQKGYRIKFAQNFASTRLNDCRLHPFLIPFERF
jgi:hypothetical protein